MIIAIITAVIIVLAMSLVGSLLISALDYISGTFRDEGDARSFQRCGCLRSRFFLLLVLSLGIVLSILCSTPVGATIVILDLILFFINCIIGKIMEI